MSGSQPVIATHLWCPKCRCRRRRCPCWCATCAPWGWDQPRPHALCLWGSGFQRSCTCQPGWRPSPAAPADLAGSPARRPAALEKTTQGLSTDVRTTRQYKKTPKTLHVYWGKSWSYNCAINLLCFIMHQFKHIKYIFNRLFSSYSIEAFANSTTVSYCQFWIT